MCKAPGKNERKGITAIELIQMFPDNEAAEQWFENARWGGKPTQCPLCDAKGRVKENAKRDKPLPYHCGACRRHFSVKTNSIMHRSKINFQQWAIGFYLWSTSLKGVSSMKLHRELGITQKSAYFMAQRLRKAWES